MAFLNTVFVIVLPYPTLGFALPHSHFSHDYLTIYS